MPGPRRFSIFVCLLGSVLLVTRVRNLRNDEKTSLFLLNRGADSFGLWGGDDEAENRKNLEDVNIDVDPDTRIVKGNGQAFDKVLNDDINERTIEAYYDQEDWETPAFQKKGAESKEDLNRQSCLGKPETTIIVITPTYKRGLRIADMTRMANTLSHISNLHWIVVEDANQTVPAIDRLLKRTGLHYVYMHTTTPPGVPKRGWAHRDYALAYVRKEYADYKSNAVVYFADDDNSYDIRVFNDYIRNVKKVGVWAVGSVGGSLVEAPNVENGKVIGWHATYLPSREFATDMAGFALNLKVILEHPDVKFQDCGHSIPENCFIHKFGLRKADAEPFGWDSNPKELVVWHTKTNGAGSKGGDQGYFIEKKSNDTAAAKPKAKK